jgi:hypothetical protein
MAKKIRYVGGKNQDLTLPKTTGKHKIIGIEKMKRTRENMRQREIINLK